MTVVPKGGICFFFDYREDVSGIRKHLKASLKADPRNRTTCEAYVEWLTSKLDDDRLRQAERRVLYCSEYRFWGSRYEMRSIGKFLLDLKTASKERSKIVVRFELPLDGTLKVTATQKATGLSRQLNIDNAHSQFQADGRSQALARLEEMLDESDEFTTQGQGRRLTCIFLLGLVKRAVVIAGSLFVDFCSDIPYVARANLRCD